MALPHLDTLVDRIEHPNTFGVMPLGDVYDAILGGEQTVTLRLANYIPPNWEGDIQRVLYGARYRREPWTHDIEVALDETERRSIVVRKPCFSNEHPKRNKVIVFSGTTAVGSELTPVMGVLEKVYYGWASLPDIQIDKPDIPALKVLAGEVPVPNEVILGDQTHDPYLNRTNFGRPRATTNPYAHLYGTPEQVLSALRKHYELAGSPYMTPSGLRSY